MASLSVSATCLRLPSVSTQTVSRAGLKMISGSWTRFPSLKATRFRVSCAAKPATVQKVCDIVRTQLALAPEVPVTPESKFADVGADSLDTVEIVMSLEEEFEITIEEQSAQDIQTVQDAADLIEELVQKKTAAA